MASFFAFWLMPMLYFLNYSFIFLEHESCATDINELKWHCAYQGRLEARLRGRVDHAGQ